EPDLPINARLIWREEWRPAVRITGLGFKLVLFPFRIASNHCVICSLKDNFVAFAPYCPECAVSVDEVKQIIQVIHQLAAGGAIDDRRCAEPGHPHTPGSGDDVGEAETGT